MRYASQTSLRFLIMKKILITSLCFAGVAAAEWTVYEPTLGYCETVVSGAEYSTWEPNNTELTWTSGKAFSIALTVDATSLDTSKSYTLLSIRDVSYNGLANISLSGGNANFVLWNETSPHASVDLSDLGAESSLTFVLSRTTSNELSLTAYADNNFTSGTSMETKEGWGFSNKTFTQLNFGGTTANYLGNVAGVMPSNAEASAFTLTGAAYMTGGTATAADLQKYSSLVPEPTTACLSLLALAGLAARRRRK